MHEQAQHHRRTDAVLLCSGAERGHVLIIDRDSYRAVTCVNF
jgi:hypothetical protein